jgi:uncharacterized protein (TIGR02453 family)
MTQIPKHSLDFLKKIKANNNREWFHENKPEYQKAHEGIIGFADQLLENLNKHDNIKTVSGKKSMYRIYRDVRFSKNKTPYNVHWSGGFARATDALRGGYYFRLEHDNFLIGGGFWGPNPKDLKRIREEIDFNDEAFRSIFNQKKFKETFGELVGEEVKTSPKGYSIDNPNIDLLRKKQFILSKSFTIKEVLDKNYHQKVDDTYKQMREFFDLMSEVLTTDSNGESII